MINTIKKIVKNYINSIDLTEIQHGVVVESNPLQIKIDKLIILNTKIVVPIIFKELNIELKKGDKVTLLRQQGGQLFFLFDKS